MSSLKNELSRVLNRLINALNHLSADELSKLADDSYNIEIRLTRKRNKDENFIDAKASHQDLISKLTNFNSREEAQQFLDENCPTRKLLEPVARSLDIPILRQDRVDILRDKIIESTVGARIRSEAIQGIS